MSSNLTSHPCGDYHHIKNSKKNLVYTVLKFQTKKPKPAIKAFKTRLPLLRFKGFSGLVDGICKRFILLYAGTVITFSDMWEMKSSSDSTEQPGVNLYYP